MVNFKELAKRKTDGSPILSERTKIETDALIAKYPNGVTINGFDFLTGESGEYVVCSFREDPGMYFNGGKILTDIFLSFVDEYEGNIESCMKDFGESGGLKVKLSYGRTKKGNKVTLVDVL